MEPESAGQPSGTPGTDEALVDARVNAPVSAGREMPLVNVGVSATVINRGSFGDRSFREDFPDADVAARMAKRAEPVVAPRELEDPLTPREVEVLGLMAGGRSNRELAEGLSISPGTVRSHVQNIIAKLEVSDRTGAVVRGIELGLIRVTPERRGS
jgi:DNA-binding CsgD family transcriptional regulator